MLMDLGGRNLCFTCLMVDVLSNGHSLERVIFKLWEKSAQ